MKRKIYLQIAFVLFSLVFCSLESKIGSEWFKDCLLIKTKHERCTEVDFMFSMIFLKKQENSAVFSPIGCDMNILVQCYDENFELKNKEKGRIDLTFIQKQMRSVVSDTFDSFTCSYKRYELKQRDITYNGFIQAHYSKSNEQFVFKKHHEVSVKLYAEQMLKEHIEWLKNKAQVFLSTPLKTSFFINNDKIYGTFVHCNEIWAKEFIKNTSSYNRFFLSDGRSSFRNFLKKMIFLNMKKLL